jgi:hypothetical protein
MGKYLFLFLVFATLVIICKPARAVNEYLNDYPSHCSSGSIELYSDVRGNDEKYTYLDGDGDPSNSYRGYDDDISGSVGIRWRKELGSSCTDPFKRLMIENMELKQELELLKLCGRYKELDLGPNFSTVREKCKDVNKKEDDSDNNEK